MGRSNGLDSDRIVASSLSAERQIVREGFGPAFGKLVAETTLAAFDRADELFGDFNPVCEVLLRKPRRTRKSPRYACERNDEKVAHVSAEIECAAHQ